MSQGWMLCATGITLHAPLAMFVEDCTKRECQRALRLPLLFLRVSVPPW
jgi:hypothetical protein